MRRAGAWQSWRIETLAGLYDQELVTFEEGKVAYDHRDAEGFIKLNALRLRVKGRRDQR
jgi:argininosuccinate synthase